MLVDDHLQTSDPDIFAIGEVALHRNMIYGLVAPGYEMADMLAANLTGQPANLLGADLSTKLKLMGVDVASFGNCQDDPAANRALTFEDPFRQVYKKLLFNLDGSRLLGGILVGDATDYGTLLPCYKSADPLPVAPAELLLGKREGQAAGASTLAPAADDAQVCSCNNVSQLQVCQAIRDRGLTTLGEVKTCTKAGTGCGGCLPLVTDLLKAELAALGQKGGQSPLRAFPLHAPGTLSDRQDQGDQVVHRADRSHGQGHGCEICKPAVASILASLWNENVMDHTTLQDTNDRFLANMQRGGLYSVVPRIPGGEITPEKADRARGRSPRSSGCTPRSPAASASTCSAHACISFPRSGKTLSTPASRAAMLTARPCAPSRAASAQRGAATAFRTPSASPCASRFVIAESARPTKSRRPSPAASANAPRPRAKISASSPPRKATTSMSAATAAPTRATPTCWRPISMKRPPSNILTASSCTTFKPPIGSRAPASGSKRWRAASSYLRDVIVHDRLGICDELERQMQFLVDTYQCEWKEVVDDPEKRRLFQQFVNTDETEPSIEFVSERGQRRPADWPSDFVAIERLRPRHGAAHETERPGPAKEWVPAGKVWDFPIDGGRTIQHGKSQIAVFHFRSRGEWYACQNMCPHKKEMVLSRGIIGDQAGVPKVACPLHKKTFSLDSGTCLSGEDYQVRVFPVKVEGDDVYVELPPAAELDELLRARTSCAHSCV